MRSLDWSLVGRRLADAGLRLTPIRKAVLHRLHHAPHPVTASTLAESVRGHRVTVYRALEQLRAAGLVAPVNFQHEDFDRFELAAPLRPHHHHLVCESCGGVWDVAAEPSRPRLPRGFKLAWHQLEFYGSCAPCRRGA